MHETEAKITPRDEWQITTERFVAFIDIMGFKEFVFQHPNGEVYKMFKTIGTIIRKAESESPKHKVKSTTFSDSIIIYSKDSTKESLHEFLGLVSFITSELFANCIPHKGAVSYGEMTFDLNNSIYFGKPLIEAYTLQEEVEFYGIVLHGKAEEQVSRLFSNKSDHPGFLFKYDCIFKQGRSKHLTIYPMNALSPNRVEEQDRKRKEIIEDLYNQVISGFNRMYYMTSGHLRKYLDRTEDYFNKLNELTH